MRKSNFFTSLPAMQLKGRYIQAVNYICGIDIISFSPPFRNKAMDAHNAIINFKEKLESPDLMVHGTLLELEGLIRAYNEIKAADPDFKSI